MNEWQGEDPLPYARPSEMMRVEDEKTPRPQMNPLLVFAIWAMLCVTIITVVWLLTR